MTNRWFADNGLFYKVMPYWSRNAVGFSLKEGGKWKQAWIKINCSLQGMLPFGPVGLLLHSWLHR